MDYSSRNIVINELIGLRAKVVKSLDRKLQGTTGTVVDETKNTLVLETQTGTKSIIKKVSVFKFYSGNRSFTVDGEEINFRPHERTEKAMKYYRARK